MSLSIHVPNVSKVVSMVTKVHFIKHDKFEGSFLSLKVFTPHMFGEP